MYTTYTIQRFSVVCLTHSVQCFGEVLFW